MAEVNTGYYIAPNSEIRVLKSIPLDDTYEHTIGWGTNGDVRGRQERYFKQHTKFTFKANSYQRATRGWIRLGQPDNVTPGNALEAKKFMSADDFYDCNYMMFQNTSFGNKWFYAFITAVEYINDNTTQISYEIDVMQTWLEGTGLDFKWGNCYIERQHSPTDGLYDNLVPESVETGDDYVNNKTAYYPMNDCVIMFVVNNAMSTDINYEWFGGHHIGNLNGGFVMNNMYGNVEVVWFEANAVGIKNANDLMKQFITKGKEEDIVNIFMVPRKFVDKAYEREGFIQLIRPISAPTPGDELGILTLENNQRIKYKPRNNKLYSYPYTRLLVSNQNGGSKEYKFELFNNAQNRCVFKIVGSIAWTPSACAIPIDYRGFGDYSAPDYSVENVDDGLTFEDFPICAWCGDAFKAWWAQNANTKMLGLQSGLAAMLVAGLATPGAGLSAAAIAGMWTAGSTGVARNLASIADATHHASRTYGNLSKPNTNAAIRNIGFVFACQTLRADVLKIVDDFFTKYGYAQKRIGEINCYARERWTYVKTQGMNIEGNLNAEDNRKICEILDNGITFWRNPLDIGHYNFSNKPNA